jgi:HPt (histidine-containing phosphotransfer) domain-containing protein
MTQVIDIEDAKKRVDGDTDILVELFGIFLDELPRMMADIRRAVAGRDAEALEHSAHSLKGSAANLSAAPVSEAARVLECAAVGGDLSCLAPALATLESEAERLRAALENPAAAA